VKLFDWLSGLGLWLKARPDLILPLILSLVIAGCDLKTRRIPNYVTFGGALGGLIFQLGHHGFPGLLAGLSGWGLGFILLLGPYLLGGLGAGDVKASAALGAWLGPGRAFALFIYMGLSGGLIILVLLLWQGRFWAGIKEGWHFLLNWLLCRAFDSKPPAPASVAHITFPYGVAMASGMAVLCWSLA
jgi:prepilin peptidase CpaA